MAGWCFGWQCLPPWKKEEGGTLQELGKVPCACAGGTFPVGGGGFVLGEAELEKISCFALRFPKSLRLLG